MFQLQKKIEKLQRQKERNQRDLDRLKRFDKKLRDEFFVKNQVQAEVANLQAENIASMEMQELNSILIENFHTLAKEYVNMNKPDN